MTKTQYSANRNLPPRSYAKGLATGLAAVAALGMGAKAYDALQNPGKETPVEIAVHTAPGTNLTTETEAVTKVEGGNPHDTYSSDYYNVQNKLEKVQGDSVIQSGETLHIGAIVPEAAAHIGATAVVGGTSAEIVAINPESAHQ